MGTYGGTVLHIILEKLSGDVPNWVAAILAGVFGAITVYFAFRLDRKQKQSSRTEKINACWTAIAVDFRNSADLATVFFDKEIMAPLYRLPDDATTTRK